MRQDIRSLFAFSCGFLLVFLSFGGVEPAFAGVGRNAKGDLTVTFCSQNLHNFGGGIYIRRSSKTLPPPEAHELALLRRFVKAECDITGVQEIYAPNHREAEKILQELAGKLSRASKRRCRGYTGKSNDNTLWPGALVCGDRFEITETRSHVRAELPRLSRGEKPSFFSRGPFELTLKIKLDSELFVELSVFIFHFKSKAGAGWDGAKLSWETARMEMAEALRETARKRYLELAPERGLVVLLGDRNSSYDSASGEILKGKLKLSDFSSNMTCRVSKHGRPLCIKNNLRRAVFSSALSPAILSDGAGGTLRYGNSSSWVDDILLPAAVLARKDAVLIKSKAISQWPEASDHSLVYAEIQISKKLITHPH